LLIHKIFIASMPPQPIISTAKDNPMQIDETRFKPLTKREKQWQHKNNICLYYGGPSHVALECPKKQNHIQHRSLLSLTQNLETRKMKTSILSRDLEIKLWYIMCWEGSQLVFRFRPSFLLLVMIHDNKVSNIVWLWCTCMFYW
jgi:hypothetical protein